LHGNYVYVFGKAAVLRARVEKPVNNIRYLEIRYYATDYSMPYACLFGKTRLRIRVLELNVYYIQGKCDTAHHE
jgi:hypothetical protein